MIDTVKAEVSHVTFQTLPSGELSCIAHFNLTPELEKHDCRGIAMVVSSETKNGYLPFGVGAIFALDFNEKHEITERRYEKVGTPSLVPDKCGYCGEKLTKKSDSISCTNYFDCLALSASVIHRLALVACYDQGRPELSTHVHDFITYRPDAPLFYLSDIKIMMTVDPNTAYRNAQWPRRYLPCWEVEKAVWNFLHNETIRNDQFWQICFGLFDLDVNPLSIEEMKNAGQLLITENQNQVNQLVNFFNHWVPDKKYVRKAN